MLKIFIITIVIFLPSAHGLGPLDSLYESSDTIQSAVEAFKRIRKSLFFFKNLVDESDMNKIKNDAINELMKIEGYLTYRVDGTNNVDPYFRSITNEFINLIKNEAPINQPLDNAIDRLTTKAEIDYVLRNYRPFTDYEKETFERQKAHNRELLAMDESHSVDIDDHYHNVNERRHYQKLIKEYHVLDPKLIETLIKARYDILQIKFKGNTLFDLHDMEKQLLETRFTAQLKLWQRNKKLGISDGHFKFSLISSDNEWKKYLNKHDDYCTGNIIIGYKNRYDDPSIHSNSFEITASRIIGYRFDMMNELFNEMIKFKVYYENLYQPNLKDLPLVDYLFDSITLLTFDFPRSRFRANQWSPVSSTIDEFGQFLVRPRYFKSKNPAEIVKKVDDDMNIAKATVSRYLMIDSRPINKLELRKILLNNRQDSRSLTFVRNLKNLKFELLKKTSYQFELKSRKNLLLRLEKKKSSKLYKEQLPFGINRDTTVDKFFDDSHSRVMPKENIDTSDKNLMTELNNNFDLNVNTLVPTKNDLGEIKGTEHSLVVFNGIDRNNNRFGTGGDNVGNGFKRYNFETQLDDQFSPKKRRRKHR